MRKFGQKRFELFKAMVVVVPLLIVSLIGFNVYYTYGTIEQETIVVTEKHRNCSTNNGRMDCKWLVMTEAEVFENSDSLFHLKWNSSDVQAKLREGEEYTVRVYGWRVPFLSQYRNIIKVVE